MPDQAPSILYLGASLPVRSETFVYREVFALRRRGYRVRVATVHPPERDLGSRELDALADEAIPIYGGGRWPLLRDAARTVMRQPGPSVRVMSLALRDALFGRGVPPGGRPKLLVQCLAALALQERTASLPLVHVHAHMAHVPTSIAMYYATLRNIPFSFTGHAADLFRDHALLPAKIRRAAFVACISHWHQDFYRQQVPEIPATKLPLVRCGVPPAEGPPLRREAGAPLQLLAVGRLVEKKGFEVLIRALEGICRRQPDVVCQLIGDGPQRAQLERLVAELGLTAHVHFRGACSNQEVQRALLRADLVVLPCQPTRSGDRDGIPVVLMEAMAAGRPVLSGDLPTIRELVRHDETGWLVPPGDVEALRQALLGLIHDPERRQRLAAAGRAWVADEFSESINIDRLSEAFALEQPMGEATCREPQLC